MHFFNRKKTLKIGKKPQNKQTNERKQIQKTFFPGARIFTEIEQSFKQNSSQKQETTGDNIKPPKASHHQLSIFPPLFHGPTLQLKAVRLMADNYFFGEIQFHHNDEVKLC